MNAIEGHNELRQTRSLREMSVLRGNHDLNAHSNLIAHKAQIGSIPIVDQKDARAPWTAEQVEARLVDAYRKLPTAPVYSAGGRFHTGLAGGTSPTVEALSWPWRFVADRRDGLMLTTWAACQANHPRAYTGRCDELGWPRASADRGRRRAAERIAACLNAEQRRLDSEENRVGSRLTDAAADPVPAHP